MNELPSQDAGISRRDFVKAIGAAALVGSGRVESTLADGPKPVGPSPSAPAETAVARFYKTLTKDQKSQICFPFDHPKRSQVNNNWKIVEPTIGDMNQEQQALCGEIFKALCSEDGYERFQRQMKDDYGGFDNYHVAVFGEPGTDRPFEWVLTGRHNTLRADGNSVEGAAFGGPIFYGHAADGHFNEDPKHTNNIWWHQAIQANAIFASLDGAQKKQALFDKAAADNARSIQLRGKAVPEVGIKVGDLDAERQKMVQDLLKSMTAPFRAFDAEEVQACLKANGGAEALRLTYYKEGDVGSDGVWDIWRLEGPAFVWYFHGSPHVHTWVNIAR